MQLFPLFNLSDATHIHVQVDIVHFLSFSPFFKRENIIIKLICKQNIDAGVLHSGAVWTAWRTQFYATPAQGDLRVVVHVILSGGFLFKCHYVMFDKCKSRFWQHKQLGSVVDLNLSTCPVNHDLHLTFSFQLPVSAYPTWECDVMTTASRPVGL